MTTKFDPQPWKPPKPPPREGIYAENDALTHAELWDTGGIGPEDVAVAEDGTAYIGIEDGSILGFPPGGGPPQTIASTGGRPLGVELLSAEALVVCDAYEGLLLITKAGEVTTLVNSFGGEPFLFTNNATIARDGTIYFTVSSDRYTFEESTLDLLEHSPTGRLFARHPDGSVELLQEDLQTANGVALDATESSVFVAETGSVRVSRYWLTGRRAGSLEVFADNLPGYPDNLSFGNGVLWVGLVSTRVASAEMLFRVPSWVRSLAVKLPDSLSPKAAKHGFVLGFDEHRALLHNLQDPTGRVATTTGAVWHDGRLFVSSLEEPHLAVVKI